MVCHSRESDKYIFRLRSTFGVSGIFVQANEMSGRPTSNKFSENLQAHYSALYRTRQSYFKFFKQGGFTLLKDEDMFDEGHVLNKFLETRLRIYLFKKNG